MDYSPHEWRGQRRSNLVGSDLCLKRRGLTNIGIYEQLST